MDIIFWITFVINILAGIYFVFLKKHYFSIYIFLFIGVYTPLFLYMLQWSDLITKEIDDRFYLIFIYLNLALFISNIIYKQKISNYSLNCNFKVKNIHLFTVVNIIYILLYFGESYLGSGSFIPALQHIDIHTYSAPIISFITKSQYVILLMNILFYISTKKKKYLLLIFILILIPVITRGARMQALIAGIQLFFFIVYYLYCNNKRKPIKIKKSYVVLSVVIVVGIITGMVKYTDYRMNHFGKYDLKYEETIGYTGPEFMKKPISIYYGYFPLSFNNLNINIMYSEYNPNYIGLYSFKSIYFGLFQLDNILGLDPYKPETDQSLVTSGSATVPTGFYDYYYDFGYLCFIPLFVALFIYMFLYKKLLTSNILLWKMLYFYYIPNWIFMSFQNVLFGTGIIYDLIFIFIAYKLFIYQEINNKLIYK